MQIPAAATLLAVAAAVDAAAVAAAAAATAVLEIWLAIRFIIIKVVCWEDVTVNTVVRMFIINVTNASAIC